MILPANLTLRTLCEELSTLRYKRYQIGVQLGISHNKLMEFEKEDDPLAVSIDYWLAGNAEEGVSRCWQSVVSMLRSSQVDESGIAKKIEEKYCSVNTIQKSKGLLKLIRGVV